MEHSELVIQEENSDHIVAASVLDDHWQHIKGHLKYVYRFSMIKHIIQHLHCWYAQRKHNIPVIKLEDILKRYGK